MSLMKFYENDRQSVSTGSPKELRAHRVVGEVAFTTVLEVSDNLAELVFEDVMVLSFRTQEPRAEFIIFRWIDVVQ